MDDNYSLWRNREAQNEKRLARLPRCSECDEPIQDEHCFEINGELICQACLDNNHRKWVEDYVE